MKVEPQIIDIDPHVVVAIICIFAAGIAAFILWALSHEEKKRHK